MSYPDPDDYEYAPWQVMAGIVVVFVVLMAILSYVAHADEICDGTHSCTMNVSDVAMKAATSDKLLAEINHGLTCDARVIELQAEVDSLKAVPQPVPAVKKK